MNVLGISPAFYPATYWGGPVASLHGLYNSLATLPDIDLRVLTTDTAGPRLSQSVEVDKFPVRYPAGYEVYLCRRRAGASFAPRMFATMPGLVRWADVVHVTSVYSPSTIPALMLCRLLRKPLVWSPRGALQRWEATTRPRLKAIWEAICRRQLISELDAIHTTSPEEASAAQSRVPGVRVVVIPNGVVVPARLEAREWLPGGRLRLLYLGRLHPIKGIENLLHALATIRDLPVSLHICGAGDHAYTLSLQSLSASLSLTDRVTFVGHVDEVGKHAEFRTADLCVVPSFTENFGMVVAESLAHGVPVVAAHGAPWAELETHRCGFWINNDSASLANSIAGARQADLHAMGARGREWMKASFDWAIISQRMAGLLKDLAEAA